MLMSRENTVQECDATAASFLFVTLAQNTYSLFITA